MIDTVQEIKEKNPTEITQEPPLRQKYSAIRSQVGKELIEKGYHPESKRFERKRAEMAKIRFHEAPLNEKISKLEEKSKKAEELSTIDPLTGLLNPRGFDIKLREQIETMIRYNGLHQDLALVILDANGLKQINDHYGHEKGSAYLRSIGEILKKTTREIDIVARIGGDEFTVVLRADREGLENWWKRANFLFKENNIGISAGSTLVNLADEAKKGNVENIANLDVESVVTTVKESEKRADKLMYEAKGQSKIDGVNHIYQ